MTTFIITYTMIALLHFILGIVVLYRNQSPYSTENMIGAILMGLIFPIFYIIIGFQLSLRGINALLKVVKKNNR